MKDLSAMITAANDGKLAVFNNEFKSAMSDVLSTKMDAMKADIASTITIDGEELVQGNEDDK